MECKPEVMEAFAADACDDACSICLEPFCADDPAMVTNCKHEYHLQCILEWSQRSQECPICSQALALSDPASQEILAATEVRSGSRTRHRPFEIPAFACMGFDSHNVPSLMEDMDFDERIVHNRRESHHRSVAMDHSQLLVFANSSYDNDTDLQQGCAAISNETKVSGGSTSLPGDSTHTLTTPIIVGELHSGPFPPSSGISGSDVADNRHSPLRTSQSLPGGTQRSRQSEILSFSESLKSKITAASSRYKESISKSTRGFKEKMLARNNSVKELSKEVQREVTAGIAGVARLMERLDPTSKRGRGFGSFSCATEGTSELSHHGDFEAEGLITQSPDGCTGTRASVSSSYLSNTVTDPLCLSADTISVAHVKD